MMTTMRASLPVTNKRRYRTVDEGELAELLLLVRVELVVDRHQKLPHQLRRRLHLICDGRKGSVD